MPLLSFDTVEPDVPREHAADFTLEHGMAVRMRQAENRGHGGDDILRRGKFYLIKNINEHD